jgi:hypothetical protein
VRRTLPVLALLGALLTGCTSAPSAETSLAESVAAKYPDLPADERRLVEQLTVTTPRDATGIAACDLLTPTQLRTLGLDPDRARGRQAFDGADICAWKLLDGTTSANLRITRDNLAGVEGGYQDDYAENFAMLRIGGHPAIRKDFEPVGECVLFVALNDAEVFSVEGYVDGRILPDPCAPARAMAEAVLSNLPLRNP